MKKFMLPLLVGAVLIFGVAILRLTAHNARNNLVAITITSPNSEPQKTFYSAEVLSNNGEVRVWSSTLEFWLFGPASLVVLGVLYFLMQDLIEFARNIRALIAILVTAITLFLCTGTPLTESIQKARGLVQPTPISTKPAALVPLDANQNLYYLGINIDAPKVIEQGQSDVVEISLGIFDNPPNDSKLKPIGLFQNSHFYGIPEINVVNFDLPSNDSLTENIKRIELNKTTTWSWVLTPSDAAEGNQSILWNFAIDDGRNKEELSLVSLDVRIDVKPKYGIPSFLLNPNFSLVGLFVGILSTMVGVINWRQKREEDRWREQKEEEAEKIAELIAQMKRQNSRRWGQGEDDASFDNDEWYR